MDRRDFLKFLGWSFTVSLLPFGMRGWAAGVVTPTQLDNKTRKRLIVLFQRGAVDGLNIVIPAGENDYYDARPTIAIPGPGGAGGALELDDRFALNPNLSPVLPFWKSRSLAFIPACGSPNPTRSHFDAQDYMELGTPGDSATKDGWLNRLLAILSTSPGIRGISLGSITPKIMQGKIETANLPSNPLRSIVTDRPIASSEFEALYKNDKELLDVYKEGLLAHKQLQEDLSAEYKMANNGAPSPDTFVSNCSKLAQVIAKDPALQIAFLDVGGWDTHINQTALLNTHLKPFGLGVEALAKGLGDAYANTLIVVLSEFGRTVKENGRAGTDHGHGNVLWLLGGPIQGGKIYGEWQGLKTADLYEGRDVPVTTDFRHILGHVVGKHFQLSSEQIATLFPNTPPFKNLKNFEGIYA